MSTKKTQASKKPWWHLLKPRVEGTISEPWLTPEEMIEQMRAHAKELKSRSTPTQKEAQKCQPN